MRISRRSFLKQTGLASLALLLDPPACAPTTPLPNILYILADDLGYNEVGCYGQEKIKTPNIDQLAAQGMRFTQHYSGSAVCAPTRCMLLTGKHSGHAYIRGNDEMGDRGDVWKNPEIEGQRPMLENTPTIGTMLQKKGYKTACIGKWGLGWYGTSGEPNKQGFDHYYGYICQRIAHNYYPTHLWKDGKKDMLNNSFFNAHQKLPKDKDPQDISSYAPYKGKEYAPDFILKDTLEFIRSNKKSPLFIYWCTPVPHVSLQVPEDSLKEYLGKFEETPYKGERSYLPHYAPRAAYAAMVTRMDRDIGRIIQELKDQGLYENTLIVFSSDNGPTFNGGTDSEFFESNKPFSGLKCSIQEGGIRVPMIASWPGRIQSNSMSDHVSAQWDVMATLAELTGAQAAMDTDGISFLPTLLGKGEQKKHDYLYWEYARKQAVRIGDFKGFRKPEAKTIQLFNLKEDIQEKTDVADKHPEVVERMIKIMRSRTESPIAKWNFQKI